MLEERGGLKIMPKLIIPNAYELYQSRDISLTQDQINTRYFYNLRFLWLLEPGDAIILPKQPAKGFLSYLGKIKKINIDTLHVIILEEKYVSLDSNIFSDLNLIAQLQSIITSPWKWRVEACYFNREIEILAEKLQIGLNLEWKMCIDSDYVRQANSKAEFRKLSINNNIPIPEGAVCSNQQELAVSLQHFLKVTGQVIIKQEYNASGKGNIGISFSSQHFVGVVKTIMLNKDQCINQITEQLWMDYTNSLTKLLIIEVYYPNKGSFTAQFFSPPRGQRVALLGYSEILMEGRWVGVQMPPRELSQEQTKALIAYSKQYACIMQERGYQGYLCCDAILTNDDRILFTEINVRPGAETHAYVLAQYLFGVDYQKKMVVSTRNGFQTDSFLNLYQKLEDKNLLFKSGDAAGVVLLTIDDAYSRQFEYLVVARDLEGVYSLEKELNSMLQES